MNRQDNFSTWVRRRKGIAPGTLRRNVSHQNPLEALEEEAEPPPKEEVVNAPLIGAGARRSPDGRPSSPAWKCP